MTRNFSNQRRDGMHPSSRNSASGKYREEQSSRPARPRLSRDAVDRAWENGATRTYADYRPRQHPPTSPAQRQGRPAPAYEKSRQPQNRRPYETSRDAYGTPHAPAKYDRYQQRPQQDDRQRRFDRPGYRPGEQPGFNSEHWTRNTAPQQPGGYPERYEDSRPPRFQQDNTNYRGPQRPSRFQQDNANYRGSNRSSHFQQDNDNYRGSNRPSRFQQDRPERFPRSRQDGPANFHGAQQPRPFERTDREREQFARGQRGSSPAARRDNYNPRWQSRPGPQRDYANQQRDYSAPGGGYAPQRPGRAQFEGDYERFNDYERSDAPQPVEYTERPTPAYEKPVTRLPDGRVLKGSRPSQRKQARFWNEVEGQTSELLSQVSEPQESAEQPLPRDLTSAPTEPARKPARPKKPGESRIRKVKTVKTKHAEEPKPRSAKVARKNAQGPRKQTTRPSQRGYQWPTAGGE